ncbi:hypothetical protein FMEXI_6806 [Fusarium mexicanum]|uniref:Uncharacterized protein n=1 Tax=Fusarium mexicanum TaxID=751941 RepID=A0A8H5MXK7_9HYPO|nr:hypothetical protein FMEXI_6806 [Fusarium mexicanum]
MEIDSLSLDGKIAIVTGSGRENGIGAAIATTLARHGAAVTIHHVSDSVTGRAHAVAKGIRADGGKAIVVQTSIETPEGAQFIVSQTLKGFNTDHIDILINNAGVPLFGETMAATPSQLTEVLDVNVKGPILVAQAVVALIAPGGRIVNISSIASKLGDNYIPVYGASKAALDSLTWSWAKEWGRSKGITVNAVAPGPVLTDAIPAAIADEFQRPSIEMTRAANRAGTVKDIADAVLLLVSEKARWITGQYISSRVSNYPPAVELMFVNIAQPQDIKDRKTRRRINSHVMKPIGITRRRARPDDQRETTLKSIKSAPRHPGIVCKNSSTSSNTSSPGIGTPQTSSYGLGLRHSLNLVPFLCPSQNPGRYPMSARTSSMLHFSVDQEAPVCKLMRELCFALAFSDDSAMHLVLARLEIDPERTGGQASQESVSSLTHYNASIEILRNQLGAAQLMAHEAIIGVVVNLACYDMFTNNLTRWKTHMSGLQKMIEYRGGINTLSSQYLQVTTIWMDLTGSMMLDQPPHLTLYQTDLEDEAMNIVQKSHKDTEVLLQLLLNLSNLAAGKSELELSEDSALLQELQAVVYTALTLPRYSSSNIHQHSLAPCILTYETFRLAVLVYLSGPVTFLAGNRTFNVIIPHLRGRLSRSYREDRLDWTGLEDIELFILVIGAMTEVGQDRQGVVVQLQRLMRVQGLRWNGLVDKFHSMAWVDIVWSAGLERLQVDLTTV